MVLIVLVLDHCLFLLYIAESYLLLPKFSRSLMSNAENLQCFDRDVPLTPYFHLTDGNLTKDTYNVLRRL